MNDFSAATGRQYQPFEYYGHPQAERVIILMGSAIGTCEEVVDELLTRGEKVGVLKVRLYRPFSAKHLLQALPGSVRRRAGTGQNQRTRCPGRTALSDVMTALAEPLVMASAKLCPVSLVGAMVFHPKNWPGLCTGGICRAQRG
ncbi:hypothetical protein ACLK2A_07555 [Escherichia coli]